MLSEGPWRSRAPAPQVADDPADVRPVERDLPSLGGGRAALVPPEEIAPVTIGKKERQSLLTLLWEHAVLAVHGGDNRGEPIDADEVWEEFKKSPESAGFELDLTVIDWDECGARLDAEKAEEDRR
jgi:hypothetical protein